MTHAEKCPVCDGLGIVKEETCHGCDGYGWIVVPNEVPDWYPKHSVNPEESGEGPDYEFEIPADFEEILREAQEELNLITNKEGTFPEPDPTKSNPYIRRRPQHRLPDWFMIVDDIFYS